MDSHSTMNSDNPGKNLARGAPNRSTVKSFASQLIIALLPLVICLYILPCSFFRFSPGEVLNIEDRVTIEGHERVQDGQFYLTSVSVQELTAFTLLGTKLGRDNEIKSLRSVVGGIGDLSQYNMSTAKMMEISKNTAIAVALRHEGYPVESTPLGVIILGILKDAPISSNARVGDIIVECNGIQVRNKSDLKNSLSSLKGGEEVSLVLQRDSERVEVRTEVIQSHEDEPPILGVIAPNYYSYRFPMQVELDVGGISGPSAGLMMTLAVINTLRGGGLAGDLKVAGTGEIFDDGSVGPIGGINFKVMGAAETGMRIFLVPRDNYPEIEKFPAGLEVYPVSNLDEALKVLEERVAKGE